MGFGQSAPGVVVVHGFGAAGRLTTSLQSRAESRPVFSTLIAKNKEGVLSRAGWPGAPGAPGGMGAQPQAPAGRRRLSAEPRARRKASRRCG